MHIYCFSAYVLICCALTQINKVNICVYTDIYIHTHIYYFCCCFFNLFLLETGSHFANLGGLELAENTCCYFSRHVTIGIYHHARVSFYFLQQKINCKRKYKEHEEAHFKKVSENQIL